MARRSPFKTPRIPEMTVRRLSIYARCLQQLEEDGVKTISSQELADRFSLNSAQVRKDLAYFGEFGVRVNAICAGRILTERITSNYGTPDKPGPIVDRQDAAGRSKDYPFWVGKPEDIANIALFLASEESRMITGATIPADGPERGLTRDRSRCPRSRRCPAAPPAGAGSRRSPRR